MYPGEIFQVSVIAVGQRHGTVPSKVISTIGKNTNFLDSKYTLQQATDTCTTLRYAVSFVSQHVHIELHADGSPCSIVDGHDYGLTILVETNPICPPGLTLSESARSCACEPRLESYTKNCTIMNGLGYMTHDADNHFWVGYDNRSDGLILHPLCPFDYCVSDMVVFTFNNTDIQCAHNRSGLLCGTCKKGFSLVLGTSQCKKCSNIYLILLIPFAVMGIALVFLLFVCKLTVATGTLSGLVFYANIIGVSHAIFLPVKSTNPLSVFIAWVNLDFGIEACFYNGMDTYSKAWL